jgi:hypothetical protein
VRFGGGGSLGFTGLLPATERIQGENQCFSKAYHFILVGREMVPLHIPIVLVIPLKVSTQFLSFISEILEDYVYFNVPALGHEGGTVLDSFCAWKLFTQKERP